MEASLHSYLTEAVFATVSRPSRSGGRMAQQPSFISYLDDKNGGSVDSVKPDQSPVVKRKLSLIRQTGRRIPELVRSQSTKEMSKRKAVPDLVDQRKNRKMSDILKKKLGKDDFDQDIFALKRTLTVSSIVANLNRSFRHKRSQSVKSVNSAKKSVFYCDSRYYTNLGQINQFV